MNRLSLASPFRLFADYGMLLVLLLLCLVLSVLTYSGSTRPARPPPAS